MLYRALLRVIHQNLVRAPFLSRNVETGALALMARLNTSFFFFGGSGGGGRLSTRTLWSL